MCVQAVANMTIVASSTNTSSAINVMRTVVFTADNGDRPDVNNVAIVITDGMSDDRQATAIEATAAKDAGVRMFAIGLTNEIDASELKKIASEPLSEHYFNRTSIELVETVTSQLLWSVCHDACQPSTDGSTNTCNSSCENTSLRPALLSVLFLREKYFAVSSLADLSNTAGNHTVIDFIKETHFYHQL